MTFVDRPLPETLQLPRLCEPRPRYNGKANLRTGPGIGRIKGQQNKICRDLKEGLLQGAILHGYDGEGEDGLIGYCHHLAERHPKAYASLLARLLPYNLNANVASAQISEVKIISVPSGQQITRAGLAALEGRHELASHPADAVLIEPMPIADAPAPSVAPIDQADPQMSEEEQQLVNKLMIEIRELAQRAGVSLE